MVLCLYFSLRIKGTIDKETDPLLYYTNQLKHSADGVPHVKLIEFEDLKFGPKVKMLILMN